MRKRTKMSLAIYFLGVFLYTGIDYLVYSRFKSSFCNVDSGDSHIFHLIQRIHSPIHTSILDVLETSEILDLLVCVMDCLGTSGENLKYSAV